MPTAHPRIAVVRDPELDAALERAARALGRRTPAATLLRELALRGAAELPSGDQASAERRLRLRGVGTPSRRPGDVRARVAELGRPDASHPTPASDALEDVRGE